MKNPSFLLLAITLVLVGASSCGDQNAANNANLEMEAMRRVQAQRATSGTTTTITTTQTQTQTQSSTRTVTQTVTTGGTSTGTSTSTASRE